MRKIIFLIHVTLDGFTAGPNDEMDWIRYDGEIEKYSHDLHDSTDTAIYGRRTWEGMQSYWPTVLDNPASSSEPEKNHARWYRDATKLVITRTLSSDPANNMIALGDNLAEQINAYKQKPGKNIWLLGSPNAAQEFMRLNLIDEYRLNVNPVVLGKGKRLFEGVSGLNITLVESRLFKCGVAGLRYEAVR